MSDLDRLAADLGRALDGPPLPSIILSAHANERARQLEALRDELSAAPAGLVSARHRGLDTREGSLTPDELTAALDSAGLQHAWLGLTDAFGTVGRRCGLTALAGGTRAAEAGDLLRGGPLGLRLDPAIDWSAAGRPARVCITSYEFVGPTRTGGIGTAYTSLAQALADDGHDVTVLFSGPDEPGGEPFERWVREYRDRGIEMHALPAELPGESTTGNRHSNRALQVYRWLRERDLSDPFDLIHFPEVLGHALFCVAAKRQGLAFARSTIVVGTHSSTSWVLEQNGTLLQAPDNYVDDFIERRSVEGADVVVSPSAYMLDWMRAHNWRLPERHFVQQYARSAAVEALAAAEPPSQGNEAEPTELVFFGRLEPRKGLRVFCEALDRLAAADHDDLKITFLGKHSNIDGIPAADYIEEKRRGWPWEVELISDLDQPRAVAHLRAPGARLTVIPSLADNSPNTVYEALALQIPFIASRVGGTAELIDPVDLEQSTFDPGDPRDARSHAQGADELAVRISENLRAGPLRAPRPAVPAEVCKRAHVEWHSAVARTTRAQQERPQQHPGTLAVCIVGNDPGLIARTRQSLDGVSVVEAPAHAEIDSTAELRLYVQAGLELLPDAPAKLASACANGGADVVAGGIAVSGGDEIRLPLGGPALAGLFRRSFGDSLFVIGSATLDQLGGFDARVPGDLQAHELLCRAAVAGRRIEPLPEELAGCAPGVLPAPELISAGRRLPALIDVYTTAPEHVLRGLPLLAQQIWAAEGVWEDNYLALYRNRFGRFTGQVRYFVHKYRRLQALWARLRSR